jgi:hopanoid biosynthesis associated protein HpnK
MGRLIVNADDFGLTAGVNRAIAELHSGGLLTSTTLMARAQATEDAIERALVMPALGVGCHVVLVDGEPVLPPRQVSSLIDSQTGAFYRKLSAFLQRLFTGRIRAAEIEAEAAAQIALLQKRGLRLTHVDTHKHTHMFPAVLRPVLRAARAAGIAAVRNPFEPVWAVRATPRAQLVRRAEECVLRRFEPSLRRIIAQQGLATTDGTVAVVGTGSLDAATLRSLLRQMPAGTWELVTHPGYNDADLARIHTRLRASREVEMQALRAIAHKTTPATSETSIIAEFWPVTLRGAPRPRSLRRAHFECPACRCK